MGVLRSELSDAEFQKFRNFAWSKIFPQGSHTSNFSQFRSLVRPQRPFQVSVNKYLKNPELCQILSHSTKFIMFLHFLSFFDTNDHAQRLKMTGIPRTFIQSFIPLWIQTIMPKGKSPQNLPSRRVGPSFYLLFFDDANHQAPRFQEFLKG